VQGCETGIELLVYSNCDGLTVCEHQPVFLYGEETDPMRLLKNLAREASVLLGCPLRGAREVHGIFAYFGWCSWDAFQIRVSHDKLLDKAAEFKEKGIPVHYAIIDDMWGDAPHLNEIPANAPYGEMVREMHSSPLRSFEGDPVRFPKGMRAAIEDLKEAGIPKVGIWFPTTGYWFGLLPDGDAHREFSAHVIEGADGKIVVNPTKEDAAAFYGALCERVRSWGAELVKIDYQGFHRNYRNIAPIGVSARAIQEGIDAAALKHFDGALINCMGMPSECMLHRPTSAISRCSGDFMPEDRAWFARHILQASFNGLLQGQFYVNDWDMWWTDDGQAEKNSLCRAISGGPIYVSDTLGRSRPEVLRPLMFSDGRLPLCDESATPTADCLLKDPTESTHILKICNRRGEAGFVAAFNVNAHEQSVNGVVRPSDVLCGCARYAYYEYYSGACGILDADGEISVELPDYDSKCLYSFLPYDGTPVCFGNADLLIGVGAVTERTESSVTLYEGGRIAFFSEKPLRITDGVKLLDAHTDSLLTVVEVPLSCKKLFFEELF